jgi:hypothetical protein
MEAGRRRGRGRMSRTRIRTPANLRNRAAPPREDDTTIALLRQQQQIMAQMHQDAATDEHGDRATCDEARAPTPPPMEVRPPSPAPPGQEVPDLVVPSRAPDREAQSRIGVELHWRWPPAQRKLQDDAQLSQVWTRRTQPNSWRNMSGTPWTPKYPLRRSCRRQSNVSTKQRPLQGKWQRFTEFRAEFLATTGGSSAGFEPTLRPEQRGLDGGLLHGAGPPSCAH